MTDKWLNNEILNEQENIAQIQSEDFWGKNKNGFCDQALNGIELLFQGTVYLSDRDELQNSSGWNNFSNSYNSSG